MWVMSYKGCIVYALWVISISNGESQGLWRLWDIIDKGYTLAVLGVWSYMN